ncbi:hypothetical protein P7C73_g6656, partial [Tremellales sp. Uapishka_1]
MWAGRKGLSAREPTPPPLPPTGSNPDYLDPAKLARLGKQTESFRERQRREFEEKEIGRKEWKARERLIEFDQAGGIKFHPLHVMPADPLQTLPRPLLRLIYPAQISPEGETAPLPPIESFAADKNMSAAERLRAEMRRDMLGDVGDVEEVSVEKVKEEQERGEEEEGVDWEDLVSGTKRVLSMEPAEHLAFLVSQLRNEHLFCFWCASKYASFAEMDGSGGCPGEEEDDH